MASEQLAAVMEFAQAQGSAPFDAALPDIDALIESQEGETSDNPDAANEGIEANQDGEYPDDPPLIPEMEDDARAKETVNTLRTLHNAYANDPARKEQEEIVRACEAGYKGFGPVNSTMGPQYNIREIFRQCETAIPQINNQFFGGESLFTAKERFESFQEDAAAGQGIIHDQVKRFRMEAELRKANRLAVKHGTTYVMFEWRKYRHFAMTISELHAKRDTSLWERETTEMEQGAPGLKCFDFWSVHSHPNVEDIRESPAVFITLTVSAADLKRLVREGWADLDRTKFAVDQGSTKRPGRNQTSTQQEMQERWEQLSGPLDGDDPYELVACFLSNGMEYAWVNGEHLIRGQRCKYGEIPIRQWKPIPVENSAWGIPIPLIILGDQKLLNDFMSLYVSSVHWSFTPTFTMTENVAKAFRRMKWQPGGALVVNSQAEMAEFSPITVHPTAMDLASQAPFILQNMRVASGLTDELSGLGSGQKTATGVVRIQDAAGLRMQEMVRELMPAFEEIFRALWNLNARYLNEEWALRIEGPEGRDVFKRYRPEVFEADVDIEIELSNVAETSAEKAGQWRVLGQLFMNHPLVDQVWLVKNILKAHGIKKPQRAMANSATGQLDAQNENANWMANGLMPEPKAGENHVVHFQQHQAFMQTPQFQYLAQANPIWASDYMAHMQIHQAYMQAMQASSAAAAQIAPDPAAMAAGPTEMPSANARTEQTFNNAATGAMQQMPAA